MFRLQILIIPKQLPAFRAAFINSLLFSLELFDAINSKDFQHLAQGNYPYDFKRFFKIYERLNSQFFSFSFIFLDSFQKKKNVDLRILYHFWNKSAPLLCSH